MENKLKWLTSLSQKARKPEVDLTVPPRGQQRFPVDSRYLTPRRLQEWNMVTPYLLPQGDLMEVRAWDVGKRMPSCNEADTCFNVTRHESEPNVRQVPLCESVWRTP